MPKKRKYFSAAIVVGAALLSAAVTTGCGDREVGAIKLNYSIFFPPTHLQTIVATQWAREIECATSNRVRIVIYPGGILTKAEQCYQGVLDGISDIGMSCFSYTRGRFPTIEALDLPLGYPDGATATRLANETIARFDLPELENTHLLYVHAHGPGVFAFRKKAEAADAEIRGSKIRATGLTAKIVSAIGATPVGLTQGETYEALQKGVVDGTLCPVETLKGWKQGEVTGAVYTSDAIGYTTTMFVTMNLERWKSLPPDIQKIFTEVSEKYIPIHGEAWNRADEEGYAFLRERGVAVEPLPAEVTEQMKKQLAPLIPNTPFVRALLEGCRK